MAKVGRRYTHSLVGQPGAVTDEKPVVASLPTRAWVSPDDVAGFACLVEEHPGGHRERHGDFKDLLAWALECSAQEFYVRTTELGDWERPTPDDVRRIIATS
jgi:hypothetical protein